MTVEKLLVVLGTIVGVAYVLIGIVGGLWSSHWDEASASDQILWVVFLVGGAVLLFIGLRISRQRRWPGAALVSLGAVVGALPIFWTIAAPILAIALVVLSMMYARRAGTAPAAV